MKIEPLSILISHLDVALAIDLVAQITRDRYFLNELILGEMIVRSAL